MIDLIEKLVESKFEDQFKPASEEEVSQRKQEYIKSIIPEIHKILGKSVKDQKVMKYLIDMWWDEGGWPNVYQHILDNYEKYFQDATDEQKGEFLRISHDLRHIWYTLWEELEEDMSTFGALIKKAAWGEEERPLKDVSDDAP
ncbi:MAG: hypothetical protein ACTSWQ_08490 [Candidatus Thorarchaeota archaeon]